MKKILIIGIVIALSACAAVPSKNPPETQGSLGWVLLFEEQRPGEPTGPLRILITENHVRMDDGAENSDFLLFDRKTKKIYNIVVDDETILVVDNPPKPVEVDSKLTWRIETEKSHAIMARNGEQKSQFHRYFVNDAQCRSVVSVTDLLPEALEAIKEYRQVFARELHKGLQYQAADDPCYLALNVARPNYHLQNGFPVREWDSKGYQRFLQDYKSGIIMPKRLFLLPQGYNQYSIQ